MRLGLNIGYWGSGKSLDLDMVLEAERLGYDSVWVAEAWGSDAVTVLSWIGARTERIKLGSAILQMPARTPAMTAMTAATLDELSGGRVLLGLGLSGPQVVEGWHGQPYGKPIGKTREYVEIVRKILARQEPVEHEGEHYQLPYRGPGATGLGKPLKLITKPPRPDLPIYLASLGPRNVALTAEIADGWLPVLVSPESFAGVFGGALDEGFSRTDDPAGSRAAFDIAPSVHAIVTDDVEEARDKIRPHVALYVGGMGARGKNFYNDLAGRYGYEEAAAEVQDLYLSGNQRAALAAVPDGLIDDLALVGSRDMVRDRLEAWREMGTTTLLVTVRDIETLRVLAELVG